MSPDQLDDEFEKTNDGGNDVEDDGADASEPLHLTVDVDSPSACERHVTVTVAQEDIDRYRDDAFSEMMPTATIPGFRPGRAPRKLVEHRYRKEVHEQVKGSLVTDSMSQISEEQNFAAISEPNFDLEAVEIPDEGPLTFEFDIEVRPVFDVPEWKGLLVERPVREFDEGDVDRRLREILVPHGQLAPCDRAAEPGDSLSTDITAAHDGREIAAAREQVIRIGKVLSFRDGKIEGFDSLMAGVEVGEVRHSEMKLSADAPNKDLRGQTVGIDFTVLDVKELRLPELTDAFLDEMGNFDSEADLRRAIREDLERKLAYYQAREVRQQIAAALTASATWELPPGLLERQSVRELERVVLEMRRSGFSESEIRARENELRQNSTASTARALKEHFILERIAEEEDIDVTGEDFDQEIMQIALQGGESVRRVRAQLEKRGLMDVLRNQIVERKVIDLVRSHARFQDQPYQPDEGDVEAIDLAIGGGDGEPAIPEATEGPTDS